jgi:hypothetical protein
VADGCNCAADETRFTALTPNFVLPNTEEEAAAGGGGGEEEREKEDKMTNLMAVSSIIIKNL